MPKNNQNERRRAFVQATTTRAPQALTPEDLARANRWRDALRQLLAHHQMSPAELARRINAPNPNFIYNFLNSRSHSLAQETLERICRALPGTKISDLFGVPRPRSASCLIIAEAITGVAQGSFLLPPERQQVLPLPGSWGHDPEVFGVWVGLSGSGWLYPAGTILLCRPYSGQGDDLQAGCRVIVQRPLGDGVEVTVRELTAGQGGQTQAMARLHRVAAADRCDNPALGRRRRILATRSGADRLITTKPTRLFGLVGFVVKMLPLSPPGPSRRNLLTCIVAPTSPSTWY